MPRKRGKLTSASKLKMEHILRLEMLGKSVAEIALEVGLAPNTVHELTGHEDYDRLRASYVGEVYAPADRIIQERKVGTILEEAAPEAADALAELLQVEDDNVTKRLAATAILDRAGFGPIQRKAVKHQHGLDPVTISLLKEAMAESDTSEIIDVEPTE